MTKNNVSRVLVISPLELRHRYFIKELLKDRSIDVVSVIVDKSNSKPSIKKYFSFSRLLHTMLSVYELSTLGPVLIHGIPLCRVTSLADKRILTLTNELKPQLIIVYGGKVIPKSTLDGLSTPCINIHGSVLPGYRGLDSYWWALTEKNRHLMGYSIHFIDQGIDTGDILYSRTYSHTRNSLTKHLNWRIWFAQNSAIDVGSLVKGNACLPLGKAHLRTDSIYRSRIRFMDLLRLNKNRS
jgi:methionyl-tRNA formyltransferase